MGIAPYKYFTYDGESSRDYDVYLTGTGVFNAPERAVEMVEIPGRNGNYALDKGKFNNISVIYKAGIVDYSESDFADKVSAVRNWLCSKVGYKRLSDDYNPNEYRMAVFKSGVNIEHEDLRTGTFEITFDCKPQRWLTSGETATAVANNGTLSNPTLFESEPLLAVKGYGTIGFNGYEVEIENVLVGNVILSNKSSLNQSRYVYFDESNLKLMNNSDTITISANSVLGIQLITYTGSFSSVTATPSGSGSADVTSTSTSISANGRVAYIYAILDEFSFQYSTSIGNVDLFTAVMDVSFTHSAYGTNTTTVTFKVRYNKTSATVQALYFQGSTCSPSLPAGVVSQNTYSGSNLYINDVIGDSTKSGLGNPTYIDCEIGECYMINSGQIVTLNGTVSLGSDLPKLASGTNTFTYDNTVTELKVTPRWWKV